MNVLGVVLLGVMSPSAFAENLITVEDFEDCSPDLEIWSVPDRGGTSSGRFDCDTQEKRNGKQSGRVTVEIKTGDLRVGRVHQLPKFTGYTGIGMQLKGKGLNNVVLSINDSQEVWRSPRIRVTSRWKEVQIPFKLFQPERYQNSTLPDSPLVDDVKFGLWLLLSEPYTENKPGTSGTLWIDDIYLYK